MIASTLQRYAATALMSAPLTVDPLCKMSMNPAAKRDILRYGREQLAERSERLGMVNGFKHRGVS